MSDTARIIARRRSGSSLDAPEHAVRRLSALAALLVLGWGSLELLNWWAMLSGRVTPGSLMDGWNPTHVQVHLTAELTIGASIVMLFVFRSKRWSVDQRLRAGMVYVVLVGLIIGYNENLGGWWIATETRRGGPTWQGLWLVVFPLLVPVRARLQVVVCCGLAAAGPLSLPLVATFNPYPMPSLAAVFDGAVVPNAVALILALVSVRAIHHLREEIDKARKVGSYELVEPLGRGGMGEVWRARHRMLARPAAIKLIPPDLVQDDTSIARFEREAHATAALSSPHTVALYDYGVADDGTLYYAMELLEGMDLERLVSRFGALPSERAVWMLRQLCESLAEAHAAGLIHRDIKPANIVACHLGIEYDFVKVLDFGLVKPAIDTSSLQDGALSGVNLVQGTPAYLSPEMITGAPCDARLDLYGVGCVAYWLLTGELVFKGESTIALALAHVHELPKPLSERAPHAIPPELDALVLECLAKQPDDRPVSALEVAARLDAIALAEPWSKERAANWWREHLGSRSATDSSARRE